ncbi:unnamed protein product [Nippostrongylus brasiliensis]|uniref:SCP domain-containing protein n=1 Tax=Nippostrongylus brasiliensis TaxID=27835 RepID=A0A0N4YD31_NIPBR|nr:unnamed protein product [Nippostrongylus brasiliensis]
MLRFHNNDRRAGVEFTSPPVKQMNELAWNCETEYNLSKMQLELIGNNTVVYRNFGVNNGLEEHVVCSYREMVGIIADWAAKAAFFPSNFEYNGDPDILPAANILKWNSTEMACVYRTFDSGDSLRLICAYNVRADVLGQPIYEAGNEICSDGAKCGDDGTRLVASGWAESKLTLFTPRAAGMSALISFELHMLFEGLRTWPERLELVTYQWIPTAQF